MEHLGKVIEWRDDRGFGFITPLQDGAVRVFFHIRNYRQSGRRPELGELVKYSAHPQGGRWKATAVSRAVPGSKSPASWPGKQARAWRIPSSIQIMLVAGYIGGLCWAVGVGRLPVECLFLMFGMSAIAYVVYAFDKDAARKGNQRIPETALHLLELGSGWPGALLAQLRLRHKTSKRSYRIAFWSMTMANIAATAFWAMRA